MLSFDPIMAYAYVFPFSGCRVQPFSELRQLRMRRVNEGF